MNVNVIVQAFLYTHVEMCVCLMAYLSSSLDAFPGFGDHNLTEGLLLDFPAGSTSASVVIAIDDDVYENTESFQLVITNTSDENVLIGMNNETTVNIEDDEMITVFFQEDSYNFSESDGEAVVTVYADLPTGGLAVNITLGVNITNGTAISKCISVYLCIYIYIPDVVY